MLLHSKLASIDICENTFVNYSPESIVKLMVLEKEAGVVAFSHLLNFFFLSQLIEIESMSNSAHAKTSPKSHSNALLNKLVQLFYYSRLQTRSYLKLDLGRWKIMSVGNRLISGGQNWLPCNYLEIFWKSRLFNFVRWYPWFGSVSKVPNDINQIAIIYFEQALEPN